MQRTEKTGPPGVIHRFWLQLWATCVILVKRTLRDKRFLRMALLGFPLAGCLAVLLPFAPVEMPDERVFVQFFVTVLAFWIGFTGTCVLFVRDRQNYVQERLQGLHPAAYYLGTLSAWLLLAAIQCVVMLLMLLILPVLIDGVNAAYGVLCLGGNFQEEFKKLREAWNLINNGGQAFYTLWALSLVNMTGVIAGLFVSSWARSEQQALVWVPIVTIFVIIFSQGVLRVQRQDYEYSAGVWNSILTCRTTCGIVDAYRKLVCATSVKSMTTILSVKSNVYKCFWGSRLSLLNPIRYCVSIMRIASGDFDRDKPVARLRGALYETFPIVVLMWAPGVVASIIHLWDPRRHFV